MEKINDTYTVMQKLFAELILDDSLKKHKKARLYQEIDRALERRDVQDFYTLTDELKSL